MSTARSPLDDIEVAFARLAPLIKVRMSESATSFHPQLRSASFTVLRMALIHAVRTPTSCLAVSDIVAETQMDKSVVSRQLKDLKEWGLIELERSTSDARVYWVRPTKAALERYKALKRSTRSEYGALFESWEPEQVAQFGVLLTKMVEEVDSSPRFSS